MIITKALITGASSGIGLDMARYLATKKCELILVSRNKEKLEEIQEQLPTKVTIIVADLANEQRVKELYVLAKNENIDILINNAGFGDFGYLTDTDINKDLEQINTNIKAVHILTKFLARDMENRDTDTYILNVASSAAFGPGPLMATYYATKAYVNNLTEAILNFQKFYINLLSKYKTINKDSQITKNEMMIFQQSTEIMIRLQEYAQQSDVPAWISSLQKIIFVNFF